MATYPWAWKDTTPIQASLKPRPGVFFTQNPMGPEYTKRRNLRVTGREGKNSTIPKQTPNLGTGPTIHRHQSTHPTDYSLSVLNET